MLEVVFRILPTSDSLDVKPINAENKILRFKENRDVTKQIGFNFQHVNVKHINNYGFATDRDFQKQEGQKKPIVAVIGDSYVEALQVKNKDAFHGIVDEELHNYHVYPIGVSGSPLSQYIAFARYAGEEFNPSLYIFLIIGNDFDESFYDVKRAPVFHYFNENGTLQLVEYNPSFVKKIARKSAFLRYLYLDLKVSVQLQRILNREKVATDFYSNVDEKFLLRGRMAIDEFLLGIRPLTETSNIILPLDGDRSSIYNGMEQRDISKPVNILFEELKTKSTGIHKVDIVDLQSHFQRDWTTNNVKFNYGNYSAPSKECLS